MKMESWGRVNQAEQEMIRLDWRTDSPAWPGNQTVLPRGLGRSYGDSCLNDGGFLIDPLPLNRLIEFHPDRPSLRCESGTTLEEILKFIVPRGFFLPVTPGTKHVTVGGAIANDVHGKNHHIAGTFGRHILGLELLRSDNTRFICTAAENHELFRATIGGLGLTGVILSAEIALIPITSSSMTVEQLCFHQPEEFFGLADESDGEFDYTVAWADWVSEGNEFGRGVFIRGNHSTEKARGLATHGHRKLPLPAAFPNFLLNRAAIRLHNNHFFNSARATAGSSQQHYDDFFYPLDRIGLWNRLYGPRGFYQHQCLIPTETERDGFLEIADAVKSSRERPYLVVVKRFGSLPSPGLLSFPRAGTTIALDFANNGDATLQLLASLDTIVRRHNGCVYPAKDARMSADSFASFFPHWRDLLPHISPGFSSSFWRRCTAGLLQTTPEILD